MNPDRIRIMISRLGLGMGTAVLVLMLSGIPAAAPIDGARGLEVTLKPSLQPGSDIPTPKGPVILKVLGALRGGGSGLSLDRQALEAMGMVRFSSRNRWLDGVTTYEGVLGSTLMDLVGVPKGATTLRLRALNDYVVHVPLDDLRRWPVVFALKVNGEYMSVRDKGPVWLVYPNHLHEELGEPPHTAKWIWQLKEVAFE